MCRHAGGMAEVAKENAIVICIWLVANDIIPTYTRALVLEASRLMYHRLAINSACTNTVVSTAMLYYCRGGRESGNCQPPARVQ
jgi:hypothetical protein